MRETKIEFMRGGGYPLLLAFAHDYGWLPSQVAQLPMRFLMELKALRSLEAEKAAG